MNETITPAVINLIQSGFIEHVNGALSAVGRISIQLLFIFIAFELVFFGLGWAFNRQGEIANLIMKVLYIGFIIMLIREFPYFLNQLMQGFIFIGLKVAPDDALKIMQNPVQIWQYGFDTSISILKISMHYGVSNFSAGLLYLFMGFGSLVLFALIAAQAICLVVAFYVVALAALVILPFSAFKPLNNMLSRSLQQLLKAGIRVMVLMLVLNVAATIWLTFPLTDIGRTTNIATLLGFFFSVLVILFLALRLPSLAADVVGKISIDIFGKAPTVNVTTPAPVVAGASGASTTVSAGAQSSIAQAASVPVTTGPLTAMSPAVQVNASSPAAMAAAGSVASGSASQAAGGMGESRAESLAKSADVQSRLSNKMIKQLKTTLQDVINERKKS